MDKLAVHLALNGAIILTISLIAGLFLYRSILGQKNVADWHLLHAGGTARGIMLIALAATIDLPKLAEWQLWVASWFIIYFVWTSILAMLVRAITGETGFGYSGSTTNKVIFLLYASGTATVFPGFIWLIVGLTNALW